MIWLSLLQLLDRRYGFWPAEWDVDSHPQAEFTSGFPMIDELEITTTPMGYEFSYITSLVYH